MRWFHFKTVLIEIRQTGSSVEATDPLPHFIYTFKYAWIQITFASVEGPLGTLVFVLKFHVDENLGKKYCLNLPS